MDLGSAAEQWQVHGYAILPGFIPAGELQAALGELPVMYPSADGFHDETDERRDRFTADEWAGIDSFPFRSTEASLLAVSDRVAGLAEALLGDSDLRMYTAFLYLVDVPDDLGPPGLVSRTLTTRLPAKPNWYPRADGAAPEAGWVAGSGSPELYDAEVRAAGPAGTVVAWEPGTFHRGTALTLPRGARYTLHLGYRPARVEWGQRMPWVNQSHEAEWYQFVHRATPRQLALFGFPLPGHPGVKVRHGQVPLTAPISAISACSGRVT